MRAFLIVLISYAAFSAAQAQASGYTITYRSGKLSPAHGLGGIRGAKRIVVTWTIPERPIGCAFYDYQTLTSFTDGKNTLQSLLQKGYEYDPQDEPSLNLCVSRKGNVKQGSSFVIRLITNQGHGNYKAYESYHGNDLGRDAIASIITYKHSRKELKVEDESDGGKYTISP
jgi:hypothetical protein